MQLTSEAFKPNGRIPKMYTGEGADVSPPLAWSGAPAATREFVLICDDPDAPTPEPWVHWVVYGISPTVTALPQGNALGAKEGRNSWGRIGYGGPMPPPGHGVHHYHFRLYAMDRPLDLPPGADKKAVLAAMKGHVLAEAELVGKYER